VVRKSAVRGSNPIGLGNTGTSFRLKKIKPFYLVQLLIADLVLCCRLDNRLYIEVVFNQIAPDYLEGLLLVMPGEQIDQEAVYQVAQRIILRFESCRVDR